MKLLRIARRNVLRNPRRSILSIVAISVAALAITVMFSLLEGIKSDMRRNTLQYETGEVRIRNRKFDQYEYLYPVHYVVPEFRRLVEQLRGLEEYGAAIPRINIPAAAFRREQQIGANGLGIDLALQRDYLDLDTIVAAGRLPAPGSSEAILGQGLAKELGVGVGDRATFLTQTRLRTANAFTVDVVGLASFPVGLMDKSTFIMPIESASRFMRMGDAASEILVMSRSRESGGFGASADSRASREFAEAISALLEDFGDGQLHAVHWSEASGGYSYLQFADVAYNFMALFFFFLGATVVINTTMMMIHERTCEIGTMGALGMQGRELVRLFFLEAAILGLLGSALGVGLGIGIVIPLQETGINFGQAMDIEGMSVSSILRPVLNMRSTLWTFLYSFAVAALASWLPARRAARMKPAEALRS